MATYVIGDVQGCYKTLVKLFQVIGFNKDKDQVFLLGDIVNRGPNSLEVLRLVKNYYPSVRMCLGNHDIHAVATYLKVDNAKYPHNFDDILHAPDCNELMEFLRAQPFIIEYGGNVLVHAGILPAFSIEYALSLNEALMKILQSTQAKSCLHTFYDNTRRFYKEGQKKEEDIQTALASFLLLRMCEDKASFRSKYTGTLDKAPQGVLPWFKLRNEEQKAVYFGHWAALGFYRYKRYTCLDSGCVWGNTLSALRLEDNHLFECPNIEDEDLV